MTQLESNRVPSKTATLARADQGDRDSLITLLRAQFLEHDIRLTAEQVAVSVDRVLADPTLGLFIVARVGETPVPPSNRAPAYPGAPPAPLPEIGSSPGDTLVGVAYLSFTWTLEHGGISAWLDVLYVTPSHRSQGIGRSLLTAACDASFQRGCVAVDLEIEASHARAANLYLRLGFRPHARTRWVRRMRTTSY